MPKLDYGSVGFGQNLDRSPAHPAQRGAQYFLRSAICIRVRGVEGRDSSVKGGMNAVPRGVVFDLRAVRQPVAIRSKEHTSELQSRGHLVCRLLRVKNKQAIFS